MGLPLAIMPGERTLNMLDSFEMFFMAEQDYLRVEAMDLFERCLTEGNPLHLMNFIQEHIAQDPPHLTLLQDIADDLQQRLIALRKYHLDIHERDSASQSDNVNPGSSWRMTTQLRDDVIMTEQLVDTLADWIDALTTVEVRRYWGNGWQVGSSDLIH